ncbi:FAD-dependent monooxygenase [Pseudothioclava nitratireducens]|uniref:FAD-dependent monooxygenase n=1 Tax=Pseudothioclava nitratireducens TaxID=1928646 RepID=UPI0023DC2920|nr:FAD-dependent monooxygenase [Defluviimonas nitratireducens]MDF1619444.1 FAD-dependent monooxygenase [Defluviimonas nitratireducens]
MLIGKKISVLGAGVAGLAVARALALRGAEVTVFEQADAIREVGAGLQISPNGARVLHALGLGEALSEAGPRAEAVQLIDGETEAQVARLELARLRPGAEYRFIHRARLIDFLAEGAREAGVQVRLLQQIDSVELGDHPPRMITYQGAEIESDLLIGADGLHSKVRQALNGTIAPFFTHQVAWRALIPCGDDAPNIAQVFMGAGKHVVSYPLGRGLRNIVAIEERRRWVEESWTLRDDPMTLRAAFEDFGPTVRGWLDEVQSPWLWGLFRHPVARAWHGPGAAILGDAAHPTLPFLAQGAVMAIEDAWVLSEALATHDTSEAAFAAYQTARRARCERIVEAANKNARNYHLSGLSRTLAHTGLRSVSRFAPARLLSRFDWVYDHDVTAGAPT